MHHEELCPEHEAAFQALLDQIVEQRVEIADLRDLVDQLVEVVEEHEMHLELLMEEDEVFEEEDEE